MPKFLLRNNQTAGPKNMYSKTIHLINKRNLETKGKLSNDAKKTIKVHTRFKYLRCMINEKSNQNQEIRCRIYKRSLN